MEHGSIHLHGHLHSNYAIRNTKMRKMDVGLDGNNMNPWNITEIFQLMENIQTDKKYFHHYKE